MKVENAYLSTNYHLFYEICLFVFIILKGYKKKLFNKIVNYLNYYFITLLNYGGFQNY